MSNEKNKGSEEPIKETTAILEKPVEKKIEKKLVNFLENRKVKVMPISKPGTWKQNFTIIENGKEINNSGYMLPGSLTYIQVPMIPNGGGTQRQILNNTKKEYTIQYPDELLTEQEFFERELGLEKGSLNPVRKIQLSDGRGLLDDTYWKKNEATVKLKNEATELDLSDVRKNLQYKILMSNSHKDIAPNLESVNRRSTYRFVILDIEQALIKENDLYNKKEKAFEHFMTIKNNIESLKDYMYYLEGRITNSDNYDFIKNTVMKIVDTDPDKYLKMVQDPFFDEKLTIYKAIKAGLIKLTPAKTYKLDTTDIGEMNSATRWMKDPENFDKVEILKQRIKNTE
jgi:hypothetical protein